MLWGNGSYDFPTIYNMPNWLRKFIFNQLREHINPPKKEDSWTEGEAKAEAAKNKVKIPDYITRASKK